MSKLEELIEQYCPDGVEYVRLGDVMSIQRGASPRPIQNYLTDDEYGIPWIKIGDVSIESKYITSTKERVTKEGAAKSRFLKKGSFILSNSMSFGRPYILEIDGCIHDGWISMCDFEKHLLPDFLYYLLRSSVVQDFWISKANSGGAVTNLNSDIVRSTLIPVPPLPVQEEIVRVLDTFTELQAELQAELQKRKQQYNYYLDNLLNFKNINRGGQEIKWMKMSEVASFTYGYTSKAQDSGNVRYIRITDITDKGQLNPKNGKYISLAEDVRPYLLQKGDLIMARTGATYGKTLYYNEDYPSAYASFLIKITLNQSVDSKYYWHFTRSSIYWEQANRLVGGGAQPQFNTGAISQVKIPLPSIEEQQRIADILDRFDTLTNDLTSGLPAEMEKRRQQYEFYRDKLLTFKRKEA